FFRRSVVTLFLCPAGRPGVRSYRDRRAARREVVCPRRAFDQPMTFLGAKAVIDRVSDRLAEIRVALGALLDRAAGVYPPPAPRTCPVLVQNQFPTDGVRAFGHVRWTP